MTALLALWRVMRVVAHVMGGLWTLRFQFAALSFHERQARVQSWSRRMLRLMGVRLLVHGEAPEGAGLLLSNHISWLDIVVINAARPSRFVAKSDIRHWPVIGRLVEGSGAVFIEREKRRDAMRVVHHVAERLRAGDVVAVFPEGTTGDGCGLLPFHANLLQAAVVTDAPAWPLGLRYSDARDGSRHDAPTYVGDTTLVASLWRTLRQTGLQAEVRWGEPDTAQGRDRRTWSEALRLQIAELLDLPLSD